MAKLVNACDLNSHPFWLQVRLLLEVWHFNLIMLNFFFTSFNFQRFCQSGLYLDFFVKKISEVFVRNVYIYSAQFFGEKYVIEELTKKIFKKIIIYGNKKSVFNKFLYSHFFIQMVGFSFYIFIFVFILL